MPIVTIGGYSPIHFYPIGLAGMTTTQLHWIELPTDNDRATEVAEILSRATQADGVAPLSEEFELGVSDARIGHRHLVALVDDRVVGVAALAETDVELVVDPEHRRGGVATELLNRVREEAPGVGAWAHGNLPAAKALADSLGMEKVRRLLVMSVDGEALTGQSFEVPEGYELLNLAQSAERFGRDFSERAWLEANNDAFSWHPEQGGWDMDRLKRSQEVSWYSDDDVLLLWNVEDPSAPGLAGFHWTKWQTEDHSQGEVYVVGLASAFRGRGLGRPVVSVGLAHLVAGGAQEVILYVEDDNEAALKQYENLGFSIAEEHVVYR